MCAALFIILITFYGS